jgi:hypothetical protein
VSAPTRGRVPGVATVGFLATVLAGVLLGGAPRASAAPQTLLAWPTRITAFAQDGHYVAWMASAPNSVDPACGRTYIRSLPTGGQRSFGMRNAPVCGGGLALGRGRALWTANPRICGHCAAVSIWTASLNDVRAVRLTTVINDFTDGEQLTGLAADERLLAFSSVSFTLGLPGEPNCIEDPVPCVYDVLGGRVTRVLSAERHDIPGVVPPALIAVGAGHIALAPSADPLQEDPDSVPAENGPIDVVDPGTGTAVMSVSPTGTVRALALSADALAVLVQRTDSSLAMERYALPGGTLLASTTVNQRTARGIDIGDKWIVYRVGRRIRLIGPGGASRLLIHTSRTLSTPIGLSIEGRRVAWVTNGVGSHRIRALLAPP